MTSVLLVEPWFGGSHRAWAEGYARHSRFDVSLLTLPPEGFQWRLRGAALTLAGRIEHRPDVVVASSLLDVAAFLGHARKQLHDVPVVLYMHENQLTYPIAGRSGPDTALGFINWNSMAAADITVFNSEYHRQAWFDAAAQFLATHPEPRHVEHAEAVRRRSQVLPVGVDLSWLDAGPPAKSLPPLIVWNQRWEHDKAPDSVEALVRALDRRTSDFRLALCGDSPHRAIPPAFARLQRLLGQRLVQFGFASRARYEQLLCEAGAVFSVARHEFFGVGVVEAMAAGATPVLPNRLSYPELLAGSGIAPFDTSGDAVEMLATVVRRPDPELGRRAAEAARRYDWRHIAPRYDDLVASVVGS